MGRSPKERFAFTVEELMEDVGGYPYTYILRAPDGERRVMQTYNSPTTWPTHFRLTWYRVGGQYVTTWKDWRHNYLPWRLWKQRLNDPTEKRRGPTELWRCDVCETPVHEYGGDLEKGLRDANWGDWKRLDDGQGKPVMRCFGCVRDHGTELRKEEAMPHRNTYVVGCWSCRKRFDHQETHYVPAKAWQEAITAGWRVIDGTMNGHPISTPERPHLRCPDCEAKTFAVVKPKRRTIFSPATVLSVAWAVVNVDGWVSLADAEKLGTTATVARVAAILRGEERRPEVRQMHVDLANETISWVMGRFIGPDIRGRTRFERLVWEALSYARREGVNVTSYSSDPGASVPENVLGLIATGVFVFREGQRRAERKGCWEALKGSRPVGRPGGQLPRTRMTITHSQPANKTFNGKTKTVQNYKLVDEQGNAYKWWGTDKVIAVGNSVTIEHAEIVKHEVYDGITFTVITRCRIAK